MSWRIRDSYFESCNCDAICPCRRIDGAPGGRSTHGICTGVLSWLIEEDVADGIDLSGLPVALAIRHSDDEPGSPWTWILYLDAGAADGDASVVLAPRPRRWFRGASSDPDGLLDADRPGMGRSGDCHRRGAQRLVLLARLGPSPRESQRRRDSGASHHRRPGAPSYPIGKPPSPRGRVRSCRTPT